MSFPRRRRNVIPDQVGDPGIIKLDSRLRGNDSKRRNDTSLIYANPSLPPCIKGESPFFKGEIIAMPFLRGG